MTTKTINAEPADRQQDQCEHALADDMQLTTLLRKYPDFLVRHPEMLAELEIPHAANGAASLIERQVDMLRDKLRSTERRMNNLLNNARDNDRLAQSRHRLAVNLIGSRDLDEVISVVLDELGNELDAEFPVIKLITRDRELMQQRIDLYVNDTGMEAFSTMMKHRNPVCGRSTLEQKQFLFGRHADEVASAAIIPLVAGEQLGLLGLGSRDRQRFHSSMGTDFLRQLGELLSATFAVHMEPQTRNA